MARIVDGGDGPVAGASERAGALDDISKDGLEVEAFAHPENSGGEGGDALAKRLDLVAALVWIRHRSSLPGR